MADALLRKGVGCRCCGNHAKKHEKQKSHSSGCELQKEVCGSGEEKGSHEKQACCRRACSLFLFGQAPENDDRDGENQNIENKTPDAAHRSGVEQFIVGVARGTFVRRVGADREPGAIKLGGKIVSSYAAQRGRDKGSDRFPRKGGAQRVADAKSFADAICNRVVRQKEASGGDRDENKAREENFPAAARGKAGEDGDRQNCSQNKPRPSRTAQNGNDHPGARANSQQPHCCRRHPAPSGHARADDCINGAQCAKARCGDLRAGPMHPGRGENLPHRDDRPQQSSDGQSASDQRWPEFHAPESNTEERGAEQGQIRLKFAGSLALGPANRGAPEGEGNDGKIHGSRGVVPWFPSPSSIAQTNRSVEHAANAGRHDGVRGQKRKAESAGDESRRRRFQSFRQGSAGARRAVPMVCQLPAILTG